MKRLSLFSVLVALALLPSAAAIAQSVAEIADAVERRGYYADQGTISINEAEDLALANPTVGFVALAGTVDDADFLADDVVTRIESRDTVIVLTADQVGVSSTVYDSTAIDAALDRAFATTGDSYATDFRQFVDALGGSDAVDPDSSSGGGFSFGWVVLIGVAIVGVVVWRNGRRDRDTVERRLNQAKAEIGEQMSVIANHILEVSDRVGLSENDVAESHFRRGSEIFQQAEERLERARSEADLEALSDDLDDARWELEAAEAILRGEEPPPPPEEDHPEPCFFDPTHGAGVEEATLQTATGDRKVMVCKADADRLRRGEQPAPREITVGRRSYPAPQAPRSHGGRGMDWLDVFSVIVGGMGQATRYRWDDRGRGRGGLGGLGRMGSGIPRLPGRSTGGTSRSTGGASRSTPRPSRSVKGRGRRSR